MSRDPDFRFDDPAGAPRRSRTGLWLALFGGGLLGVLAYWYFNPAAQPGFIAERLPSNPAAEITLYRWQDENGEWVVSDQPPPEGTDYETVSYRQDTNVLPPVQDEED